MKNTITIPMPWVQPFIGIITFVFIAVFILLGISQLNPPSPVPATAPLTEFSSGRAMEQLRVIGQRPHAMGTAEHTAVREYIVKALTSLGVPPEVQQTTVANPALDMPVPAGTVYNIVGRLNGTGNTRAIMLAAHYDSVLAGAGANDDGAGVVAMLETLRAIKAGPPLQNDVIFLFTDGEEAGLLGAKAFVDEHPWARDVGLVLNLEARGNGGPSLMFETSPNNGWLIQEFAKAAPRPFTSSLFYNIYQYLPNNTDFTIFKAAGMSGFNVAYIDGLTYYHSLLDRFENVGEGSLQHHGLYALALTRHFGNLDLRNVTASDAVYFDLFGAALIRYPGGLALPLAALGALAFVGVVVLGFRRRQLTIGGIVAGFFALLLNIILAALLVVPLQVLAAFTQREFIYYGDIYSRNLYLFGLLALITALTATLHIWFRRRIRVQNLAVAALLWWVLLAVLTSLLLPGGSYLFIWPLLFGLLGLGIAFWRDQEGDLTRHLLVLLLCAIPVIILFVPFVYLLFITLTIRLAFAVAVVVVLFFGLLVPHLSFMAASRKWLLPAVAALAGVGFLVAAALTSGSTPARPQPDNVLYGLNADTGSAIWASTAVGGVAPPDAWSAQFFSGGTQQDRLPNFFPDAPNQFIQSQAPAVTLAPPKVDLLDDKVSNGVRTLRLRVTSPRQAPLVFVYVVPSADVLGATVNGKPIDIRAAPAWAATLPWGLVYWAVPSEGIELALEANPSASLNVLAVDRTEGLPELPNTSFKPRPDTIVPSPSLGVARYSNATLVSKSFTFAPQP